MDINQLHKLFKSCSSVSIDTRTIEPGALFFAIKGENFDGNKFALKAIESGAKYAVVSDEALESDQLIYFPDTLIALQELAHFHRLQLRGTKFIALTGSNGKTTTKELVAHFLAKKFKVQYTQGNYNNHLGVPLTLLTIENETEFAVIEMGANHLYEIQDLCLIAEPDFGFITNIGKAHIGEFGGQENIFKAKTELYDFLKSKKRLIFYNSESKWLPNALKDYSNKLTYKECYSSLGYSVLGLKPKIICQINEEQVSIDLGGKHNAQNLECALALASYFGLEPKEILRAIQSFKTPDNRSQWIKTSKNKVFLDAYNSNPDSMKASVEYFSNLEESNKLIILGEMLELGEYSEIEHSKLFNLLQEIEIPFYLIGESFSHIKDHRIYKTLEELSTSIKIDEFVDLTLLLKGSRGMKMERLIKYL